MYISRLDWDDYRIEHIAQHDVEPDEVWEVCEDPLHLARRQGHNRYRVYGQTADGRYLFVVLEHIKPRKPESRRKLEGDFDPSPSERDPETQFIFE